MSDMIKVDVFIADRSYPLTVADDQRQGLEAASAKVNDAVKDFGERYGVRDRQDILAMVALQFAALLEKEAEGKEGIQRRLKKLSEKLSQGIERKEIINLE